jgi:hypothetical protein
MESRAARRRRRLAAPAVSLLLLAACGGPEPVPAPPAVMPPASPTPLEGGAVSRLDRLCGQLRAILAAEPAGFADLRAAPIGERQWVGRIVPEGMQWCRVEGSYYPGAEYVCRGEELLGGRPSLLEPGFERLSREIDACFARPGWPDRGWQRGDVFEFAAGERQLLWRNGGTRHRPGVSLKIEEDIGRRTYFLRLAVFTLR